MSRSWGFFAFSLFLLSCPRSAFAQEQAGSVQGIVKDSSGAVIPGATIEAHSPSTVGVNSTVTDSRGEYRFPALPPGTYEVTASLTGFTAKKVPGLQLQLGQILKLDFTLQVASLSQDVQVVAVSPIIDAKQNAATAIITKEIIDLIPKGATSLDFTSVASNAPGANDESKAGGIQIDGSSGAENRFIVDGMDTTQLRGGVAGKFTGVATVFTDFIQEVQVKSSGYAAEYGGAPGGVISAITKSGSNLVHGSAGTYFRSNNLQGANRGLYRINTFDDKTLEFTYTPDDKFGIWEPLGDFGGPLVKDKLWYYAAYNFDRQDNQRTATFRTSPPPYVTRTFNWLDHNTNYANWNGRVSAKVS